MLDFVTMGMIDYKLLIAMNFRTSTNIMVMKTNSRAATKTRRNGHQIEQERIIQFCTVCVIAGKMELAAMVCVDRWTNKAMR